MTAKTTFPPQITDRYLIEHELGHGAYGFVCSAIHLKSGTKVAVKKITRVFDKELFSKRSLRELKLLKHFSGHENITSVLDMDIEDKPDFNDIYLVQDLMEADLHQIIRSEQPLTDAHFQFFIYQLCRGVNDLKPGNLLVNADCELKICDLGLARGASETINSEIGYMTEYVATRWYRAPEIMLSAKSYTKAIDMWSVGTILAELIGGKPLFKGKDYVDQLNQILAICGSQDGETLARIGSKRSLQYINSLKAMPKVPFKTVFPKASEAAVDFLERTLQFDPEKRMTVLEALEHPYLEAYHDVNDEPTHPSPLDFSFELLNTENQIREAIVSEITQYRLKQVTVTKIATHAREKLKMAVDSCMTLEEDLE